VAAKKGMPGAWRLYRVGATDGERQPPLAGAAEHMRTRDRAAVTLARRAPGVLRAITRVTVKQRRPHDAG
jgi:hypothetical protein